MHTTCLTYIMRIAPNKSVRVLVPVRTKAVMQDTGIPPGILYRYLIQFYVRFVQKRVTQRCTIVPVRRASSGTGTLVLKYRLTVYRYVTD